CAGADVAADRGVMFAHAVVVDEDGCRPDVGVLADRGVADIRQVRHLGARADLARFDLDVGTDLHPGGQLRTWTQIGERADFAVHADGRRVAYGAGNPTAFTYGGVGQR